MMYEEDILMKNMEHTYSRMEIYDKKHIAMGLTDKEEELYGDLMLKYMQMQLELCDIVFDKHVLLIIASEKCLELIKKIFDDIGWNLSTVIYEKQISSIYSRYECLENKNKLIKNIKLLHTILKANLIEEYINLEDREIWDCVCTVISNGTSKNIKVLLNHLDCKFKSIYMILREEDNK